MLAALRKRHEREDEGFTLIELMVVVLIIGILLAIAVPTFLNAQNNAKTKAATSNLRSSLSAVKTVYADKQTYFTGVTASDTVISAATLKSAEPSLNWIANTADSTAGPATSAEMISFAGDADTMGLATRSALGECFYIVDDVSTTSGGTTYYKTTGNNANCVASLAPAGTTSSGPSPKAAGW